MILEHFNGMTEVLLNGLDNPVGIALDHKGEELYFIPTPAFAGSAGGRNKVSKLNLSTREVTVVHAGDPEPTDVTVAGTATPIGPAPSPG